MRKYDRQRLILSLIQEQLSELLLERDVVATQATISRDIKELRITKVQTGDGVYKYTVIDTMHDTLNERLSKILRSAVLSIKPNRDRILINTISYAATVTALAITNRKIEGIAGIIAGHDTILIEVEEGYDVKELAKTIEGFIY